MSRQLPTPDTPGTAASAPPPASADAASSHTAPKGAAGDVSCTRVPPINVPFTPEVDDRRAAEAARREADRHLVDMLERVTDAFLALDRDWRITYMNAAALRINGKPLEAVVGKTHWEEWPFTLGTEVERQYRRSVAEQVPAHFEHRYRVPGRPDVWHDIHAYPSDGGLAVFYRDVTEERRAAVERRRSEARYRALVRASAQIVWVAAPDGTFAEPQPEWAAFTGQTFEQYGGWGWLDAMHPDDRARTAEAWARALEARTTCEVEYRVRRHDGVYRTFAVRAVPVLHDDGSVREWVGMETDITDRRAAEAALARQSALTRLVADNATAALFMMDRDGHPTYMNPAAVAMSGYTLDEIAGIPLHYAVHHHHPDGTLYPMAECPIDRALPENFDVRAHEDVFIRKDGTFFPVVCAASPILENGIPVGTVVEVRDVTEEKRTAQALLDLNAELEARHAQLRDYALELEISNAQLQEQAAEVEMANEELQTTAAELVLRTDEASRAREAAEAANAAKSHFLSTMSHELRTPLNAIGGYVEILQLGLRGPLTEQQRADLERVRRSSQYLLSLINDVLNVARLDAGQVEFRIEDVRLDHLLADLEALIAPQFRAKPLVYEHESCADALVVRADPERLRQVLLNLLTNAGKFTPAGGRVRVMCEAGADAVRIHIADTGRGIAPDQLEQVFEPFVQVDRHLTHESQQGVGLGLAIARDLARRMGGDLTAESAAGVGSTFTLMLPRG